MKEKRYFVNENLKNNMLVTIEGEEYHHMANVMRSRVGERVCLFNGDGNFYFGNIKNLSKKYGEVLIDEVQTSENEPQITLDLYQALAKGDKLSLITQKITEIGASNLCLFDSKFCDVKANTTKHERLETIAISAAKQCGRATITGVVGITNIKEVASKIKNYDAFYVAYEAKDGKTLAGELIKNESKLKKVAVMIGAEGGFSEDEIELLEQNGAIIVSLGKRILRTETAAIACSALVMQILEK